MAAKILSRMILMNNYLWTVLDAFLYIRSQLLSGVLKSMQTTGNHSEIDNKRCLNDIWRISNWNALLIEILLIIETTLQSCQSWPINWRSWRWAVCERVSRPDGISDLGAVVDDGMIFGTGRINIWMNFCCWTSLICSSFDFKYMDVGGICSFFMIAFWVWFTVGGVVKFCTSVVDGDLCTVDIWSTSEYGFTV